MCGIFAYSGDRDDAPALVFEGIKQLEYRGYDSWGISYLPGNKKQFITEKHLGKIGQASLHNLETSSLAIGHTRWATHGGVTINNTHPHFDPDEKLALVHNGIVENYQQLKNELERKSYKFVSETDSEVVVNLIADYLKENDFLHASQKAIQKITGCNAFVIVNKESQEIIGYKTGSPLVVGKNDNGFFFASDPTAISQHCQFVHYLFDGELVLLQKHGAAIFNCDDLSKKSFKWEKLDFSNEDIGKNGFEHFLLKEAFEQPAVIKRIAENLHPHIEKFAQNLDKENYFVGCGSAYHAALIGRYLFGKIANKSVQAFIGSEFYSMRNLCRPQSFTTFISQSGETIDIVEQAQFFKKNNLG
ncbi:MAG: class II glutamine amidotransferase [Patescibacteria group bacterium]